MTDYYKDAQERADKDLTESLKADAAKIKPFVDAMANGEVVEVYSEQDERWNRKVSANFLSNDDLRMKPRTILVNGFEVPEPLTDEPKLGDTYFMPHPPGDELFFSHMWCDDKYDRRYMKRRLAHTTKEAAIAHAKAMLGINPND